jgi:threonine dehydrogenase-like Zn-dependent dehydrogenase
VCGSNLPVWDGRPWFDYPLPPGAPGHEGWGHVEQVGPEVHGCAPGDRVAFLCEEAFAEAALVPAADVVVLPSSLDGTPFPGEPLGCGFNVGARCGFAPGQKVAVVGVGFLGAIVVALAARAGAEVVAISRRTSSLETARKMGAADAVPVADADQVGPCDVVVEAVGAQESLDLAGGLVGERGRLVIAGYHQDGRRSVDLQLWNWRGIDVINAHERDPAVRTEGIRLAAQAVTEGWFDPSPLYTHTFPLDQAGAAMDAMARREPGFVKALVLP